MSFEGSGTGSITYQILNELPVNAHNCIVTALEDDGAGTLTLNVGFTDINHGAVQVGIAVFNYSPLVTQYSSSMDIGFNCETPLGGWASGTGSSVSLNITQQSGTTTQTYSGSFNASNLMWVSMGNEDSMTIKFALYNFQVTESSSAAVAALDYETGSGSGSVTYQIGDAPFQTAAAQASTVSYYNDGSLYSVILNLQWTDDDQGNVVVMIIVDPFTGTGTYRGFTMMFSTSVAGNGNWNGGEAALDVIYSARDNVASWQGTLVGTNLVWQGSGSQPDLNVDLSALTLTIQDN
jgi:hypothetical protein